MQLFLKYINGYVLKQEKSEMEDFEEKKLWFLRNNTVKILMDTLEKISQNSLLFQNILSLYFYFEKKNCIFQRLPSQLILN